MAFGEEEDLSWGLPMGNGAPSREQVLQALHNDVSHVVQIVGRGDVVALPSVEGIAAIVPVRPAGRGLPRWPVIDGGATTEQAYN